MSPLERTFSIIKPDAVKRNLIGEIFFRIEKAGFQIIAVKMLHLTEKQVDHFYFEHKDKDFFLELKQFMTSGPVIIQVLEGENAVIRYRELIGTIPPETAVCGTIRSDYALDICHNSIHGSDTLESAAREINFFFSSSEIYSRRLCGYEGT
ncbi:nucleoside diphosphate kinase [Candidatus Photodesmus katoptron]|uniref:nucleoside-diphosphate kinase n=1 Tax=Candidatus Photodesmus anomalopis TaxID=28176 RepID=UPI0004D5326B|nr:nucleoside-diphosphate kinase [Candidatus Photodesmus katoptron]KEY89988.1 nucleoside diphosphate kinase [Candidatus Photodesmus katoptron]